MGLQANFEFLFVGRDDNSFLENYSYDLFQDHGEKSGQIFVNLEIQNNPVDAEEIGSAIFETIQKTFFEDVNRDPYERFEMSLKAVNEILNEFKKQKVSGYLGNLNVVIATIVNGTLYLTQSGDAEAYLIRKRFISVISEGLNEGMENEDDIFVNIASGSVEPGDFVLFSSTRLLRYIGKTDLSRAINVKSVSETLSEINDVISTEILGRLGLTGILFEQVHKSEEDAMSAGENRITETIMEASDDQVYAEQDSISGKFVSDLDSGERVAPKKTGGSSFFSDLMNKLKYFFRKISGPGKGKSKLLLALVIVILILIVVIFVAKSKSNEKQEIQRLEKVLENVQAKIAEAETKGVYDKPAAKETLDKAYTDAMEVLNSGLYRDKAHIYLNQIEVTRDKIDNVQRIASPDLLVDLSTKREDINAIGFVAVDNRFFVYEYNALYELILDQVQDPLTIDDEESVISATGFDDRDSLVFLTKSGKLIEYNGGTMSFMDTEDGSFHKAVAIDDWSNRIYLLDPEGNQVWRYSYKATRGSFGIGEDYVSSEDIDFSNGTDMAIDSNIFILKDDGDITKLYGGEKTEFYINNPPFDTFTNASDIFTSDKVDKIFVTDPTNDRVFVYVKDTSSGNVDYETQYLFEGLDGEIRDIYVDPDSQLLYILTGSKVYKLSI
ncbi:hypothetical protein ACFL21_02955 [Patescibacteria group bacterium]